MTMTKKEQIKYWVTVAEHDLQTAESLLETKHYDWCLFLGHLVLEKILKAHYVEIVEKTPPKSHNLIYLADLVKLNLIDEQVSFLEKVNDYNLEGRYPDYKYSFYELCNDDYTKENFSKIKEMYKWIKEQLKY
jgi:HEPN domain-containing protein